MNINVKATNMELTPAIHDYVVKKITNLDKLLSKIENTKEEVKVNFEVAKATNHHKAGAIFHADCLINISGKEFYSSADEEDLYQAIDAVKASLVSEISKSKAKRRTLFHRGARRIKNMMKGIRNWRK